MNILIVVAPTDFRDEELIEPANALERAGYRVTFASSRPGFCRGVTGTMVKAELGLDQVETSHFDGVVFVGGAGARVFFNDAHAHRIAVEMNAQHKLVGAICIAPVILARAGVLAGRRATVFETEVQALRDGRAILVSPDVAVDGTIVTANGPRHAREFGERLVKVLSAQPGHPTARESGAPAGAH